MLTENDLEEFGMENNSNRRNLLQMIQSLPASTSPVDITVSLVFDLKQTWQHLIITSIQVFNVHKLIQLLFVSAYVLEIRMMFFFRF